MPPLCRRAGHHGSWSIAGRRRKAEGLRQSVCLASICLAWPECVCSDGFAYLSLVHGWKVADEADTTRLLKVSSCWPGWRVPRACSIGDVGKDELVLDLPEVESRRRAGALQCSVSVEAEVTESKGTSAAILGRP